MKLNRLVVLVSALLFAGLALAQRPALVVVLVVDGLPQEQLVKYRDLYGAGGFKRLLDDGAWYGNAHHMHAVTLTAPGHATMLTGSYPYKNGIIANEWVDRTSFEQVYNTGDAAHKYIGDETKKLDGTSPARLRVTTVGDELRNANNGQSKVIAISGKDRGAILLAGHRGTAYMYMDQSGRFASSTYYMKAHPAWHDAYYAKKPQDKWMGQTWNLLLPEAAYARSVPEPQPWQRPGVGGARTFPFPMPTDPKAYYAQLTRSPFGDEATLDFARAAIEGENLGRNPARVPDILGISLSTHDYVNHGFGPESRISQDHALHVDRALAAFFDYLDRRIGLDKIVITLSADHGFVGAPEYSASKGLAGGRLNAAKLMTDLNAALQQRFNVKENLAPRFSYPAMVLDHQAIANLKLDRAEVENFAAGFITAIPGMAQVFTRTQMENSRLPNTPLGAQVQKAWNREVSGDLYLVQQPLVIFGGNVSTHGSPYAYDTNVPLMIYGRTWIKAGQYPQAAAVADLAPTLSHLLGVRPPSGSEGRVLQEILK
jgi:predicted AlkP superfamily pyrophosphatase or phosphodiesterase